MPRLSRRTQRALATVVVALLAIGVWWLQQDGAADDSACGGDGASTSASPSPGRSSGGLDGRAKPEKPTVSPSSTGEGKDNLPSRDESGIPYVELSSLPTEARVTIVLIDSDGPFPYEDKDGSTFGNFEGILPERQRGYYAEYTVRTPGVSHRGARRIIAGDGGELYWTEDHYESFERIRR